MEQKVLIQRIQNEPLSYEGKLIYRHCVMERIPVGFISTEDISAGKVSVDDARLVVGSVELIVQTLQAMNLPVPSPNYYPKYLDAHLYRTVKVSTASEVLNNIRGGKQLFVKSFDWKLLTGKVFAEGSTDLYLIESLAPDTKLWTADPVNFVAESRAYVVNGEVIALTNYSGEYEIKPDESLIKRIAKSMATDSLFPEAYAIDWGVLNTGETALVEVNDGWAIGAYEGISYSAYFNLLATRWRSLTKFRIY